MSEEFSTFTNWQGAKQQEKMAKYQANIADSNRRATLERGVEDENRRLSQAKNYTGELRGGQLESGIYGQSAMDVLRDSMLNMERDKQCVQDICKKGKILGSKQICIVTKQNNTGNKQDKF